jgi:hypothetical protein
MTELSDVQRLTELEAIRHLKARRIRALDTKDWATYEALHAPDHYSHNDGEQRWDGAKANTARVAVLLADAITVHHAHTPEITLTSSTSATGIWAMEDNIYWQQDGEDHWLRGFGFYHETYEKRDGQWLFTSRQLKRSHVMTSPGAMLGAERNARKG